MRIERDRVVLTIKQVPSISSNHSNCWMSFLTGLRSNKNQYEQCHTGEFEKVYHVKCCRISRGSDYNTHYCSYHSQVSEYQKKTSHIYIYIYICMWMVDKMRNNVLIFLIEVRCEFTFATCSHVSCCHYKRKKLSTTPLTEYFNIKPLLFTFG
jgi:hypothetical protein